ncbi:unnamed protein product [Prorocentrum cordatum]|nr:unnamed protein product [Polarella glacialis]
MPHAAAAKAAEIALGRPAAFFLTRSAQAAFAVLVESMFAAAVARRFGHGVGAGTAWLLAVSPGPFMAAVAFLPSSIAMLHVCLVWALWLSGRPLAAVFIGSGTCVLVWPFAALLFLPLGVSALLQAGLARAVLVAAASFVLWAAASLCVDSHFYGRPVLPAWEIIRYNVLDRSEKGGPELYGVEPWYFYVANGFLNLTLALPAAAALPFVAALCHVLAGGGPRGALRGRPLHAVGGALPGARVPSPRFRGSVRSLRRRGGALRGGEASRARAGSLGRGAAAAARGRGVHAGDGRPVRLQDSSTAHGLRGPRRHLRGPRRAAVVSARLPRGGPHPRVPGGGVAPFHDELLPASS